MDDVVVTDPGSLEPDYGLDPPEGDGGDMVGWCHVSGHPVAEELGLLHNLQQLLLPRDGYQGSELVEGLVVVELHLPSITDILDCPDLLL